jgi:hypothetical protein
MFEMAKFGVFRRLANIGGTRKSPPGYRALTYIFIYHKHIFFKEIKRLGAVQGSAFWVHRLQNLRIQTNAEP